MIRHFRIKVLVSLDFPTDDLIVSSLQAMESPMAGSRRLSIGNITGLPLNATKVQSKLGSSSPRTNPNESDHCCAGKLAVPLHSNAV